MRWLAVCLLLAVGVVSACGGDDDAPPAVRAVATVEGDAGAARGVIEARLEEFGAEASVREEDGGSLVVEVAEAVDETTLRALIETEGRLEFMEPATDASGRALCDADGGGEFAVDVSSLLPDEDEEGNRAVLCTGPSGETGALRWQPAAGADGTPLTDEMLVRDKVGLDRLPSGEPVVALTFDPEGTQILSSVTARLAPHTNPLGMFLDGSLVAAPTVVQPIQNGTTIVSGQSAETAPVLSAVLKSGRLPSAVTVTEVERSGG